MGAPEVEAFLTHLAVHRQVSPFTHNQALSALLFVYGRGLGVNLPRLNEIGRPPVRKRLPVVLAREEVARVLRHTDVATTMTYTHVLNLGGGAVRSLLDALVPLDPLRAEAASDNRPHEHPYPPAH
jgi:hypothetical protein